MLTRDDFPETQAVADDLCGIRDQLQEQGIETTDVRLQVTPEGSWAVHSGDASYDQDHRGYWGADSVSACDDDDMLSAIASDLIEQAKEHAACDNNYEGD